jgi:hypothetical protein
LALFGRRPQQRVDGLVIAGIRKPAQKAKYSPRANVFRFAPESDRMADALSAAKMDAVLRSAAARRTFLIPPQKGGRKIDRARPEFIVR